MLPVVLVPANATAQASLRGCVTDMSGGGVLPGVSITASDSSQERRVVTDGFGCYGFENLPAGVYSVEAALAGFVTGRRDSVNVVDGNATARVDFALCLGGLGEVHWVVPGGLEEIWRQADAVVSLRIVATASVRSECPHSGFEITAVILQTLKDSQVRSPGMTVTFFQDEWMGERVPYAIGQEMIAFLLATQSGFRRLAGPYSVFLLDQKTSSVTVPALRQSVPTSEFLAMLRALEKR